MIVIQCYKCLDFNHLKSFSINFNPFQKRTFRDIIGVYTYIDIYLLVCLFTQLSPITKIYSDADIILINRSPDVIA